ncbi:nicotinate-nucleotide--dimethylbenzimidazole phosphoribosyltransferase, partial [Clostridioides difficile]|uniref:nicotinate-nucleotide--dimethylbenzimidazole phosphoribosyltransferase n=1 Tax=Clostridioides difficile TaxID=1496 RepID=UPI003AA85F7E
MQISSIFPKLPVVIDGFISYAAALIAYKINPKTREYMIASHLSAESGTKRA